jgi:hypothetical protein
MRDIRYLTDSYDEKIKQINDFGAPLNFVFITDEHNRLRCPYPHEQWDMPGDFERAADHIASIRYILDRCPGISCVVNGGDIGNDTPYSTPEELRCSYRETMDALYSLGVPVHCCIGNHDDASWLSREIACPELAVLPEEMHEICMKYNPTEENYYYTDMQGYRLIFLNSCDHPFRYDRDGLLIKEYPLEISHKQAEWLENDALKTDRKILVFSHAPISNEGIFGSVGKAGGYVRTHDDTLNSSRVYTALKSCPNVVMLVHGHVHYDNLLYRDRMVVVTTLCSFVDTWAPSCPPRVLGTPSETAFDVFSIKGDLVKITRFGAGCDRMATLLR